MSGREWKPGDVARFDFTRRGEVGVRIAARDCTGHSCAHLAVDHFHLSGGGYTQYDSSARPLVVIDVAEERWLPNRLRLDADRVGGQTAETMRRVADQIEAQQRPPRPEEPTGLGAVVRLADGTRWIRYSLTGEWWFPADEPATGLRYADLDVVEVLSEGVAS